MLDLNLLLAYAKDFFGPLLRRCTKSLWVQFDNGEWSECNWSTMGKGYINNPHDGGMFHKNFGRITKIEDYTKKGKTA